jgi:hypothetical protein
LQLFQLVAEVINERAIIPIELNKRKIHKGLTWCKSASQNAAPPATHTSNAVITKSIQSLGGLSLLARDAIMCPFALASPAPFLRRKRPNNQLQSRLTSVEARPGA